MIVSNSTVLIYLSKIGKLGLLNSLFKTVIIPQEVKREVVDEGKKKNHPDSFEVEKAIRKGWIKVMNAEVKDELRKIGIDKGEAEVISLAYDKKLKILLDQTHARESAQLFGLSPRGTIYVLLTALRKRMMDYDDYLSCLFKLIEYGFRMSEEVYIEAIRMGKELGKRRRIV